MFYNTTHEGGETLAEFNRKAASQEEKILNFFRANPGKIYPAPYIGEHVPGLTGAPLTSIRRGLTDLTNQGKLEKTDQKYQGPYGRACYGWRLSVHQERKIGYVRGES